MKDTIYLLYDHQYQEALRAYHEALKALTADYGNAALKARHAAAWEALQRRRQEVLSR